MTDNNIKIRRAKHDKENPYYMAARVTAQDKALSYEALGVLHYILSKPDDWEIQPLDLIRNGCKRNRVYRLLNELIENHYIERIYNRDAKGKVQSVEYVAHETPYLENPLPTKQEMDLQEMEKQEVEIGYITEYREEQNKEKTHTRTPLLEPFFEAIASVWNTRASGFVNSAKAMMRGTSKHGEWSNSNFDPPANPAEILEFGQWYKRKNPDLSLPRKPEKIQHWFYEYRAEAAKKITRLDATPVDLSKWENPDPFSFLESELA